MKTLNRTILLYGSTAPFDFSRTGVVYPFITTFLAAAISTAIGLYIVIKACHYLKIYDQPNGRKVHHKPIPRLGGIVFMPSAAMGLCAGLYLLAGGDKRMEISISTIAMTVGALIVYCIGFFDDRFGMKAYHKFIFQGISALFLPLCGLLITDLNGLLGIHQIPLLVGYPLTVLLIMTIVNAINLIDGIDGLASGLCILILSAYAYVAAEKGFLVIALTNTSIVGALAVFFLFNYFGKVGRMKIFMGDAGSLFLGYICAYMSIKSLMRPIAPIDCGEEQVLISVSLLFVPVIDVIRVALQRWFTGHPIFEPDKTHIHHLFMAAGLSMHGALLAIILLFFLICGLNYWLWDVHLHLPVILLSDIFIYILVMRTLQHMIKGKQEELDAIKSKTPKP